MTKNIRYWDITEHNGFSSGNEGIRDLVLAACCEGLMPNYVMLICTFVNKYLRYNYTT